MKTPSQMSEESMQRMEARIPELAGSAVKLAYLQALTLDPNDDEARRRRIRGGGLGASSRKDGHHCAIFPANGANTPVEIFEISAPVTRSTNVV